MAARAHTVVSPHAAWRTSEMYVRWCCAVCSARLLRGGRRLARSVRDGVFVGGDLGEVQSGQAGRQAGLGMFGLIMSYAHALVLGVSRSGALRTSGEVYTVRVIAGLGMGLRVTEVLGSVCVIPSEPRGQNGGRLGNGGASLPANLTVRSMPERRVPQGLCPAPPRSGRALSPGLS